MCCIMLTIYDIWALMIYGILLLLLTIVIYPLYNSFKFSTGRGRRIRGEILRDMGIALLVGDAFKFGINETSFYVILLISSLFIIWGVIMKEDNK